MKQKMDTTPWRQPLWWMAGLLGLISLVYFPVIAALVPEWLESEEYSHGLILPLVAVYLLWTERSQYFSAPYQPSNVGVLLLLFAQFLYFAAVFADIDTAQRYALLLSLLAIPLSCGGVQFARRYGFIFIILFLSIPLPYLLNKILTTKMQLISTDLGVWFIRQIGLSVYQEGNIIDLGHFKMLVAEACAGLRYMYPLFGIAVLVAYFFKSTWWQKIVICLLSIPITIFMNSLRIALTGLIIKHFGQAAAEGFLHDFEGWVVFMAALLVLLGCVWLMTLFPPRLGSFVSRIQPGQYTTGQLTAIPLYTRIHPALVMSACLLVGVGAVTHMISPQAKTVIPERQSFVHFPLSIGERRLRASTLSREVLDVLKADDYFVGDYYKASASPLNLYIAYYEAQRDGSALHSPRACLPGGGWEIVSFTEVSIEGTVEKLNRALIRKGQQQMLVYYWIKQQSRTYANEFVARASLMVSAALTGRSDGALIRVIAPITDGDVHAAEQEITAFIRQIEPKLSAYLPD